MSSPLVLSKLMWGYALYVPETLSNFMLLSYLSVISSYYIALLTTLSIKSYKPLMLRQSTRAKFFFMGNMLTPLMLTLVLLALFNTLPHNSKSDYCLSRNTMTVMCMVARGCSKSLSSSLMSGDIWFSQIYLRGQMKGTWIK